MKNRAQSYTDYFKGRTPRSMVDRLRRKKDDEEEPNMKIPERPTYSPGRGGRISYPERQPSRPRTGPMLSIPERLKATPKKGGPTMKIPENPRLPGNRKSGPTFSIPENNGRGEKVAFSKAESAARTAALKRRLLKAKKAS